MSLKSLSVVILAALCAGCSTPNGILLTHSKFAYPNSDIGLYEVDNAPLEESRTVFVWDTPPLTEVHDLLYARALKRAEGQPVPRSLKTLSGPVQGKNVQPILINQKLVTETTTFPFLPIVVYNFRLEGTLAAMDVFEKGLY